MRKIRNLLGISVLSLTAAASAQSPSITYTYDPLGRLEKAQQTDGGSVTLMYDEADNRASVTVTESTTKRFVVVPLNGYTVVEVE